MKIKNVNVKMLIVGILMTFVLLPIIVPKLVRARSVAHLNTCINHLQQIDGAKQMWAKENNKGPSDVPTWNDLTPYLGNGTSMFLVCPDGGTYTPGRVADAPKCSFPNHRLN